MSSDVEDKESFKKLLDPDTDVDADNFHELMSSSSFIDASLVEFSRRSDQ